MGRTESQKANLQGVVDTAQSIAAAYDRNKALEAELKIIELQDEAYKANLDAQKAVVDAQKAYADVLKSTIETMQDFIATLDGGASPLQNLSTARANFQAVAGRAASGDTSAYKDLTPAARAFLDLSENYSRSIQDYQRDEAKVRAALNAVITVNQNELDKLPKEIAEAADPTKQAWSKLQDALNKQANANVTLAALSVDQEASKRRLRTAEETLADRYVAEVLMLDEVKRKPLMETFKQEIAKKFDEMVLPDYSATFSFDDVLSKQVADVLPKTPMTNEELNAVIAQKFPGLEKSDFHVPLTSSQLSDIISGKFPKLTKENLIGVPANMVDQVNAKLATILPANFAGSPFDAKAMMQAAIDQIMATLRSANVAPDRATSAVNNVQAQAASATASGTGTSTAYNTITAAGFTPGSLNTAVNNVLGSGYTDKANIGTFDQLATAASAAGISGFPSMSPSEKIAYAGFTPGSLNTAVNAVLGAGYTDKADIGTLAELIDAAKLAKIPGFAVGTNYVPQDMLAQIHEGEAIIPAPFNPERYGRASGNDALVAEIKALRAQVENLQKSNEAGQNAIASNTRKTAQTLTKFDTDGMPETRT